MPALKRLPHVPSEEFNPTVVSFTKPKHHYSYLNAPNGDWLATTDGKSLHVQGFVDDAAIWDATEGGFRHATTGLEVKTAVTAVNGVTRVCLGETEVDEKGETGAPADFTINHGPELLPSHYLELLNKQGWVALSCVLSDEVTDGLQKVGCVDGYKDRKPVREAPLAQDPAVAKCSVEPVSLWLTREYMKTKDIRLGHSPGVSALTKDDGQREVQGWHTDFPYLWGTGDRIPVPSGDLVLGMQRNVCVSDFNRHNGATLFKLGSHDTGTPPPEEWGISNHSYRRGFRENYGLPYGGPESDLVEAPAGSIVLYDARTWHRAGMNMTEERRGAMIQAIVPSFIIPFMDTSGTFKSFLDSDASDQVTARELREVDKLMVHKITGPAGLFAITVDQELTKRAREQQREAYASAY